MPHRGQCDRLQTDLSAIVIAYRRVDDHRLVGRVDESHAGREPRCIVEWQNQTGSPAAFQSSGTFRIPAILASLAEDGKSCDWSRTDHLSPADKRRR